MNYENNIQKLFNVESLELCSGALSHIPGERISLNDFEVLFSLLLLLYFHHEKGGQQMKVEKIFSFMSSLPEFPAMRKEFLRLHPRIKIKEEIKNLALVNSAPSGLQLSTPQPTVVILYAMVYEEEELATDRTVERQLQRKTFNMDGSEFLG